jgi:DNA-binding transcriptional MerR regulator
MKDRFSIGEFSELFHVDVQTLRYYDSVELLVPASRDPKTGYRHYRFDQVYQLASIRYLRRLGYSLKQIRDYLDSRSLGNTMEYLRKQSAALREQWNELNSIDLTIQRKLEFIEQKVAVLDVESILIKSYEDRFYLDLGSEEKVYGSEAFYFYPTLVFYENNTKRFGAYLFNFQEHLDEQEISRFGTTVSLIPGGRFLCGYHQGPYETMYDSINRISEAGKGLKLDNLSLNFNIIDQFVERDSKNFVTEIQIPILE